MRRLRRARTNGAFLLTSTVVTDLFLSDHPDRCGQSRFFGGIRLALGMCPERLQVLAGYGEGYAVSGEPCVAALYGAAFGAEVEIERVE